MSKIVLVTNASLKIVFDEIQLSSVGDTSVYQSGVKDSDMIYLSYTYYRLIYSDMTDKNPLYKQI